MEVSTREVADALNLPVNVIEALEADDFESTRSAANRLNLVLSEMQSNIPAWNYVRGLQLLTRRCSKLGL